MKTVQKLFLAIFIVTNLFLAKAIVLPTSVNAQPVSACQIGNGGTFSQGDPISVSAQGNSFSAGDWTYIQGFTVDPTKSQLELGYLMNMPTPGYYTLQSTIPSSAESGATYVVRVLHNTTVNDCGTIIIGGGIPAGGNPGPNADCSKADVNGDGKVNLLDAQLIAENVSPAPYNSKYDIIPNGVIDTNDIFAVEGCFPPLITLSGRGSNPCDTTCDTALGPIPTDLNGFSTKLLSVATGIAGGIALILMVIGAIRVLMSSGDPKAAGAGREMIMAAVAGLLFLIFAVLILRFIGINLLGGIAGL